LSEVLLCDYCGKPVEEAMRRQCRICGGIFHVVCYRHHTHDRLTLTRPPKQEWEK
jgi:hypothetical protein